MSTRKAVVANLFYPGQPGALHADIHEYLHAARHAKPDPHQRPKVLVLPHAGYVYSGPIAASGYRLLSDMKQQIRRVVLLGPSHRVALRGMAVPTQDAFATPFGNIPLDTATIATLVNHPAVGYLDAAHQQEHSLEVHLPFLQETLGHFLLIPMVVGEADPATVADVLNQIWGDDETLIVVSSDLSHYLPYDKACERDRHTAERILRLDPDLEGEEACGCKPLNGLLLAAKQRGLRAELLDLRNSGDTAGSKDRVVGYGAFAFYS